MANNENTFYPRCMEPGVTVHAFPDVNILVHFPVFDGLDWRKMCGAQFVIIHITQPVLKELNKIKDTAPKKAVRTRAAAIQRRLKDFLQNKGDAIRLPNCVTLQFDSQNANVQRHPQLDPTVSDDALVSAVLTFRAESDSTAAGLVTDDSGLGLIVKAAEWGVTVFEPPDQLKFPPDLDADERENQRLRKRIAELEQFRPNLSLSFVSGGQLLQAAPLVSDISADIETRLARLRERYKKLPVPPAEAKTRKKATIGELLNQTVNLHDVLLADRPSIEKYNAQLDEFFAKAERVIRHNALVRSRMIRLEMQIENGGPAPGKDILADMHFPNGLKPMALNESSDVFQKMPTAPRDPTDLSWFQRAMASPMSPASFPSLTPRLPNEPSLYIRKTNSYNVRWHLPNLRQGYTSTIDPVVVLFDDRPISFPISYTIVADNSADVVEGTLNVVIKA